LLLAPSPIALEDRLRLAEEHDRLLHHYLRHTVAGGESILPKNVLSWPLLDEDVVPVEIGGGAEPNWMIMNQGATVEIWLDDSLKVPEARVLAVITSGKDSWALLAKRDLKLDSLGAPNPKWVMRVKALP
jgi:hypothetical protein